MDAWVRKLTRVASVNSSATLHAPCAARFQNASSAAAIQNFLELTPPASSAAAASLPPAASLSFLSLSYMGMKHRAAMTPRTAPMVPAEGGPGMLYTYLNATLSDPRAEGALVYSLAHTHTPLLCAQNTK